MSHRSRELQKYPKKVIWVYEVIGTYFVDQYYNHLYVMAKKAAEIGHAPNITDGYRANVMKYQHGISSNATYYKQTVAGLHEYYQKHSGQGTTTIADFEDQVLTQFIPDEFYDSFTSADRNTALRDIVVGIATTLCEAVVSRDLLPRIIDDHPNTMNVAHLQEIVVSSLCTRRDDYFVKFAKQVARASGGHNNVDIDTFNALKTEFINEKRARCDAETNARKLQQMLAAAIGKIKSLSAEMGATLTSLESTKKRNDELIADLTTVRADLGAVRAQLNMQTGMHMGSRSAPSSEMQWNQLTPQQSIGWDRGRQREKTPYPRDIPAYSGATITEVVDTNNTVVNDNNSMDILGITTPADNGVVHDAEVVHDISGIIADLNEETEKNKQELIGWGLSDELW